MINTYIVNMVMMMMVIINLTLIVILALFRYVIIMLKYKFGVWHTILNWSAAHTLFLKNEIICQNIEP